MRILTLLVLAACYGTSGPPPSTPPAPAPPAAPAPLESYAFHYGHGLVKLDLAAERMTPLHPVEPGEAIMSRSAGVIDGRLYTCLYGESIFSGGGRLGSIDLATGEIDRTSYHHCIAVTTADPYIWILPEHGVYRELEEYRNLATLRSGSSANREIVILLANAEVIAASATHLVVASGHKNELATIDRATAELLPLPIELGDDERIQGMAATRARLYIALQQGIAVFDLATGQRLRTLFPGQSFHGLTAPRSAPTAGRS